jgi:hypothetical protein
VGPLVVVDAPLLEDEPRAVGMGREAHPEEGRALGVGPWRVQNQEQVPGRQGLDLADGPAGNELAELADELGQVGGGERRSAQESSSATL